MYRLFQHYQGKVTQIEGLTTLGLRLLIDEESENEDIILLWMQTTNYWLRIFIDGCYCGIDQYEKDQSHADLDDGVYFKIHDNWIEGLTIKNAFVESGDLPLISLTINFTNGSQLVLICNENEKCNLIKRDRNNC